MTHELLTTLEETFLRSVKPKTIKNISPDELAFFPKTPNNEAYEALLNLDRQRGALVEFVTSLSPYFERRGTVLQLPDVPTAFLAELGIIPPEEVSGYGEALEKEKFERGSRASNKLLVFPFSNQWRILQEGHTIHLGDHKEKVRFNLLAVEMVPEGEVRILSLGSEEPIELVHQHLRGYDDCYYRVGWNADIPQLPEQKAAERKVAPASENDIRAFAALLAYPCLDPSAIGE